MKRTLSLLLVVALLLVIPVIPARAVVMTTQQEENITPMTDTCPCGCGEKLEDVDWQPLPTNIKGSIPEGHHYLTEDLIQGNYGILIIAGTKVVLDLRGHTWTNTHQDNRILTVQGDMWLMDTAGGGKLAPKIKSVYGGAILIDAYEVANPSFTLVSGTITSAEGSGVPGGAGVIYAWEDSKFIMTGGVVENIHAKDYGGAIMAGGTASIEILGGVIRNCSAGTRGGAIYSASTTEVVLKNATFMNNTVNVNTAANNGGGAVYSANSKITVENCTFMGNSCPTNGGGAIHAAAGLEVKDSMFIGNSAVNGGDLYLRNKGTFQIDNCTFYGAEATTNGGSIYVSAVTLGMTNSTVKAAVCKKWGGGIAVASGKLNATNLVMEGCSALYETSYYNGGGNLYAASSAAVTLTNCTLKNGFSENQGGNAFVTGSTLNMENTTVTGGVAKTGDNLRCYNSTTTIEGGNIKGDTIIENGSLNLKGAAKIGLNGAGLVLSKPTVTASELTDGAEIYVQQVTSGGTVAAAGANIEYFKGAFRSVLSGGGSDPIIATTAADGETAGYCPHCNAQVAWSAFDTTNLTTGHYYLSGNLVAALTIPATADMVIDLNGKVLSSAGRTVTNLGKLAIVDSGAGTYDGTTQWNGGVIKGSGATDTNGGVVHNNGTLKLYGGTLQYVKDDARAVERGGVFYNYDSGKFYMYGGLLDGSAYNNTSATGALVDEKAPSGMGGTFYQCQSSTFEMSAGVMKGGTAYNGGTAGFDPKVNTTITGGIFLGGTATNSAGNLYFLGTAGTGSIQISNAVITGGTATASAGNVRPGKYATNTFTNCYIAGGKATGTGAYGGNISVGTSNVTYTNCVIYGGQAKGPGGNAYSAGLGGVINFDSCLITGGAAGTNGGNIMFNHGIHKILGGEVSFGTAKGDGGNIYSNAGNHADGTTHKVTINKNSKGEAPQIFNGTAADEGGNLYIAGTVDLQAATIFGGSAVKGVDIRFAPGTAGSSILLTVGNGVTGGRTGYISMNVAVADPILGEVISKTASTGLNKDANIILEGIADAPNILAKGGKLVVAGAKGLDENGNEVWFADYDAAAAAAAANGSALKLYADVTLNLTKDTFVDLNGHTATVSGSGKLLGMDSSGDDYNVPTGKVTFTGTSPVADKSVVYAPNGNKYVALVEGSAVTFHRLGADLTSVTINIDKNAVYFKGKFAADDTLKALIDTYGIAVSLSGMPDSRLTDSLKSTYQGTDLTNGKIASGVYITNILKDGLTASQNNNRGRDKIYATAYVTLKDGTTTFISDDSSTNEDNIAWSLYDAFTRLDQLIDEDPTHFRRYTNDMRAYYEKWQNKGIGSWVSEGSNFIQPEDDGVIDVLMIGSSSCYYYVEEMAAMAEAAGIKLRVCNVYYSGCPINKYYQDWLNNYADYQFFDTTAETLPDGTIKATRKILGGGKTLEWCLAQGDWDIISMQSRGALVMRDYLKGVDHLEAEDIKEASEFMIPYVQSQFPNAKMYIKEQSSYQIGKKLYISSDVGYYTFEDLEDQQLYAYAQSDATQRMVDKFNAAPYNMNLYAMPDSKANIIAKEGFDQWEGFDQLCARIGFRPTSPDVSFDANDPHEGDHGHAGDIGGGQYLNAATWLQTIMQNHYDADFDVRDIDWVPTYYQSGKVVENRFNPEYLLECAYRACSIGWDYTPPAK